MSIRKLPELDAFTAEMGAVMQFELSPKTVERWHDGVRMAESAPEAVNIMGVIGGDMWGDGVTAAMIQRRLSSIGAKAVQVNINSPGGNFFEGQAIYNLLRQHKGEVTVNILGIAASAASVVAMAGDKIMMPKAAWLMIHNVTALCAGNKEELLAMVDKMERFDQVSADLYAERSGHPVGDIVRMMNAETVLSGVDAVDKGFADSLLDDSKVVKQSAATKASVLQKLDVTLSRGGMSRADRRSLVAQLFASKPGAAGPGTPGAAETAAVPAAAFQALRSSFEGLERAAKTYGETS